MPHPRLAHRRPRRAFAPGDITGFAWIGGPDTDLLQLNMRLPPNLTALGPVIIHEAEHDAEKN